MKKNTIISVLIVLAVSCVIWTSNSFAAIGSNTVIHVEGLTLDEAERKYGVESGSNNPIIFEVNAESGPQDCGLIIATGGNDACPTGKIFYQSERLIPNNDGTSTMKVDVYYDVNEVSFKKNKTSKV